MLFRFKLTYSGEDTTVIEPKGWNAFKSEIKRDFNSHGVVFKFTSGTLKLGFADGRDVLENAFQNDGFDAVVTLTVDQRATDTDAWVNTFTGNAVMKNREINRDYFEVDFEASTFQQKVINRMDIPVDISDTLSLDGDTLSGSISLQSDTWQTIRLDRIHDYKLFEEDSDPVLGLARSNEDTSTSAKTQKAVFGYGVKRRDRLNTINLKATEVFVTNPDLSGNNFATAIWTVENSGQASFEMDLAYRLEITMYHSVDADIDTSWAFKIIHYRGGVIQSSTTLASDSDSTQGGTAPSTTHFYGNDGAPLQDAFQQLFTDVVTGDEFNLVFETQGSSTGGTNSVETALYVYNDDKSASDESHITIIQLPEAQNVTVNHWLIHDVFDRIMYILSGVNGSFYSEFLGLTDHGYDVDGCGGLNSIVNGYKLRGINRTLSISLKDMLDAVSAAYGIGWGFEKSGGSYRLRIELMEHFYADAEMLDLGSPLDIKEGESYKENTFDDLTINNVEIGYKTFFQEIGINGLLEDFLTVSNYSLPISTVKGEYRKISPLIASNDIIQAVYDQRLNQSTSYKYDENPFIIALARSGGDFIPENDENFQSVEGLDDSGSAYNIRHAPVYMFLNHALIVNSSLMGKPTSKLIQNTSARINSSFKALFLSYAECLLADSQRLQRSSTENISIGDNFAGLRLFDPIKHEFTVAMTSTQLNLIIDAMENNSSDPTKDLGYLTYRDNEGNAQTGYPLVITWNPNDEIAEITTLEKADNYGV